MAFMAVLESDLRALSSEARRRYPAVKDGAEHAILKVLLPLLHFRIYIKMYICFSKSCKYAYCSIEKFFYGELD